MSIDLVEEAESLLDAVQDDPSRVAATARRLCLRSDPGSEAHVVAGHALGRAQHEMGDIDAACRTLRATATEAGDAGLPEREGHVRGSLALSLTTHGETDAAHRELRRAEELLDGAARARLTMQRAIMLVHQGDLTGGLEAFDQALPPLTRAGDDLAVARLLVSRGVARSLLGDDRAAELDYEAGSARAEALGQKALVASAQANIAFSRGRRGDIPGSLDYFELARRTFAETGSPRRYLAVLEADLCEVLLVAGLHTEACDAADRALVLAREGENRVQEGEALLMVARASFSAGRKAEASRAAGEAAGIMAASDRPAWAAQAEYLATVADPASSMVDRVDHLRQLATKLASTGWTVEALQIQTMLGVTLVDHGHASQGRRELESAAAGRRRGTAPQRSQAWYATALARRAAGDRLGAFRALGAGLRIIDQHRSLLGATELRLHAAHGRQDLVSLGLGLAIEGGRTDSVFRWAERAREGALSLPPVQPAGEPAVADLIAEHRHLSGQKRAAVGDRRQTSTIESALAATEQRLCSVLRRRPGREHRPTRALSPAELRRRLGWRTLLEFYEAGDRIGVVALGPGPTRRVDLAPTAEVRARLDSLYFGLRRVTSRFGSTAGLEAAAVSVMNDAGWLRETLLWPVTGDELRELVIVPSDVVADVPWNVVVAGLEIPLTVAPSARLWLRSPSIRRGGEVVAIAGPDLLAAKAEVAALGATPRTRVLTGSAATVDAALDALANAEVVHIAAHGEFRIGNPLFSSLALVDGALTVLDIEGLDEVPRLVALSACHAGRGSVGIPGEVLGTSHALVAAGAETVVAPVLAVPDVAVAEVMVALHRELARGHRAPVALSHLVAARPRPDDDLAQWTTRLLVVNGSNDGGGSGQPEVARSDQIE
jgi:tetratricopeptide (TPR) repeat protein